MEAWRIRRGDPILVGRKNDVPRIPGAAASDPEGPAATRKIEFRPLLDVGPLKSDQIRHPWDDHNRVYLWDVRRDFVTGEHVVLTGTTVEGKPAEYDLDPVYAAKIGETGIVLSIAEHGRTLGVLLDAENPNDARWLWAPWELVHPVRVDAQEERDNPMTAQSSQGPSETMTSHADGCGEGRGHEENPEKLDWKDLPVGTLIIADIGNVTRKICCVMKSLKNTTTGCKVRLQGVDNLWCFELDTPIENFEVLYIPPVGVLNPWKRR